MKHRTRLAILLCVLAFCLSGCGLYGGRRAGKTETKPTAQPTEAAVYEPPSHWTKLTDTALADGLHRCVFSVVCQLRFCLFPRGQRAADAGGAADLRGRLPAAGRRGLDILHSVHGPL